MSQIGTRFCPKCNRMVDTVSIEVTGRRRSWIWIFFWLFLSVCSAFGFCIFPVSALFAVCCFAIALYLLTNPKRNAQQCIYCKQIIA